MIWLALAFFALGLAAPWIITYAATPSEDYFDTPTGHIRVGLDHDPRR